VTSENRIIGIARVLYYKFIERVKWTPAYNPLTGLYTVKIQGVSMQFNQCPFYDIQYDDLDYLENLPSKSSRCYIDAGSYIGTLSVFLAKLSPDNFVVALEPDPLNYKKLIANIRLNHLTNVLPLCQALWNKKTKLSFTSSGDEMSKINIEKSSHQKTATVDTVTIDQLRRDIGRKIDFIKMDIEGSEIEALLGATNTIIHDHPKFVIASYHLRNGVTTNGFVKKILVKYYRQVRDIKTRQLITVTD
jgi:FkbM family methyltransferase